MAGYGFARIRACAVFQKSPEPGQISFAAAYVYQGADDGPYHISEKPVCLYGKHQIIVISGRIAELLDMGCLVCLPSRIEYREYGSLVFASFFFETAEIPCPFQKSGGLVHRFHVEPVFAVP